jgi:hypothetical protein
MRSFFTFSTEEEAMKTPKKENCMTWREFAADLRAVFADEDLRTWIGIGFIVIVESLDILFGGTGIAGLLFAILTIVFVQMLFCKESALPSR